MKKNNKGMTLIELVVVLVIIAILAAITVPSFITYIDNSKEKECASNREAIILKYKTQQVLTPDLVLADYVTTLDFGDNEKEFACPSGGIYSVENTGNQASIVCSIHGGDLVLENGTDVTPTATPTAFPLPSTEPTPTDAPEPTENPTPDTPGIHVPDEDGNHPVSFETLDYYKRVEEIFARPDMQQGGSHALTEIINSGLPKGNPLEIFYLEGNYYAAINDAIHIGNGNYNMNNLPIGNGSFIEIIIDQYIDYDNCVEIRGATEHWAGIEYWNRTIPKGSIVRKGNNYYLVISDTIKAHETQIGGAPCPGTGWLFRRLPIPLS